MTDLERKLFTDDPDGALDLDACPNRDRWGNCKCEPRCAVCRWPPHVSLHGPVFGRAVGSRPVGHRYVPVKGHSEHVSSKDLLQL